MKKIISSFIVLSVVSILSVAGFYIVEATLSMKYSNAQILAELLVAVKPVAMQTVAHLADATSTIAPQQLQTALADDNFAPISPITTTMSTTPTSINAAGSNASTVEENFQALISTLMHLQNNSTTALK